MSHRITAMLELYGGRVIGQLNLFHDKEGKSPEAGTGTVILEFFFFFIQKNRVFNFICMFSATIQSSWNTPHGGLLL